MQEREAVGRSVIAVRGSVTALAGRVLVIRGFFPVYLFIGIHHSEKYVFYDVGLVIAACMPEQEIQIGDIFVIIWLIGAVSQMILFIAKNRS